MSYDAPAANKAFREKFSFPYDLLSDQDGSMTVSFGVAEPGAARSPRKSVLIGPDGKVRKAYDEVKPAEHPDQVLADLAGLG